MNSPSQFSEGRIARSLFVTTCGQRKVLQRIFDRKSSSPLKQATRKFQTSIGRASVLPPSFFAKVKAFAEGTELYLTEFAYKSVTATPLQNGVPSPAIGE